MHAIRLNMNERTKTDEDGDERTGTIDTHAHDTRYGHVRIDCALRSRRHVSAMVRKGEWQQ